MNLVQSVGQFLLGALIAVGLMVLTFGGVCVLMVLVGVIRTGWAHLRRPVEAFEIHCDDAYLVVTDAPTDSCPCTEGCDADLLPPLIFHQMINAPHDAVPLSDRDEDAWALILNGYRNEETP